MSKPLPLLHGQYYHIYNRGVNREDIFIEPRNYTHFLSLYAKYIEPIADTFAYCLLRNHFHFLVRVKTVEEVRNPKSLRDPLGLNQGTLGWTQDPSGLFGHFFNAYAKAINKAYNRTGSLFQHPFGRIPVATDEYFATLIVYIHQNPQRHGLINDFREWPYSSYQAILSERPTHVKREEILERFMSGAKFAAMHSQIVPQRKVSRWVEKDDD